METTKMNESNTGVHLDTLARRSVPFAPAIAAPIRTHQEGSRPHA